MTNVEKHSIPNTSTEGIIEYAVFPRASLTFSSGSNIISQYKIAVTASVNAAGRVLIPPDSHIVWCFQ